MKEPRRSRRRRIGGCLEESRGGGGGGEDLLRFLTLAHEYHEGADGVSSIENRRKVRNSWGMGCRALRTGGKLGVRSSWVGTGSLETGVLPLRTVTTVQECQSTLGGQCRVSYTKCAVQCGSVVFPSVQFAHSDIVKQ